MEDLNLDQVSHIKFPIASTLQNVDWNYYQLNA